MSQDSTGSTESAGYNGGRYDLRQQTFCLSMLTCLSFNLTGRSADAITKRFRASVESVLAHEATKELIGTWKLVWGPVIYADSFVGAKASVNSLFIAAPEAHPEQVVVAIAGTSGNSLMTWMIEGFNVKEKVPWPYADTPLNPHVSRGVAFGLDKLQTLVADGGDGSALTARDYLAAHPSVTRIMVTGHSLGGALASVYSLYLEDTRAEWDRSNRAALQCLATAGQTPGDESFSRYYGERLGGVTERVWNSLDIVPHVYEQDLLRRIPTLYEPHIPSQKPIEKLIANLHRETVDNRYLNVLPEAEGFPSSFIRLEDLAGEKYRPLMEHIENTVKSIKRLAPFGAKDLIGSIEFVVHGLIQHVFPYISHFRIDEFIKIMCSPVGRPPAAKPEGPSLWERLKAWWYRLRARFQKRCS